MGWSGLKNGNLLTAAVLADFDILLSIDKNIGYQQNLANYNIAVVVFDVEKSKIEFLVQLLPNFLEKVDEIEKGRFHLIE